MFKDTIQAAVIQNWLDLQAKVPLSDAPLFRLVWSDDQKEMRTGTYRVYTNDVFIREEQITKLTHKYDYISERWVLEQWFPPEIVFSEELPNSVHGSYEPIYVFESKGQPLPLSLLPIQFLVQSALKPHRSEQYRKSLAQTVKEEKDKAAEQADFDLLNDEGPLVSQFHDGSALILPGKDVSYESVS